MLYSERKRIEELNKREAQGEEVWTDEVSSPLRTKFRRIVEDYGFVANEFDKEFGAGKIQDLACEIISRATGESKYDFNSYVNTCNDSDFPNAIEAAAISINYYASDGVKKPKAFKKFQDEVNALLESYRISYSLEKTEVVDFNSRELHHEVVLPTLRLTTAEGWEKVEKAYQDAIKEISGGDPGDAITDATTALQEALRLSGCKGENFADLLKSAKNTILKGYDAKYIEAIDNLVSWASANRSNRGDSHKVAKVSKDDAWFVVHVTGILILRLSKK